MRVHVVLVPGFGGFDALGQLHYYSGVTDVFTDWRSKHRRKCSLHYFDNLPTASVKTRAQRLRRYLTKLVDRGIIQGDDQIVLGGHSTGGLDIRQLILDLVGDTAILPRIRRLAFLSVPHRGTNLADWVRAHDGWRQILVHSFRQAVGHGLAVPVARPVTFALDWLAPGHSQLFDAVQDVGRDFEPSDPNNALEQADARLAKAEVDLWLDNTDHDFLAIDDLASGGRLAETLDAELDLWKARNISTRSYATIGQCTLDTEDLDRDRTARSVPALWKAMHHGIAKTDAVYRVAYAACAGGPFRAGEQPTLTWLDGREHDPLEDWQNDGIVNTASMVLPTGTVLVPGDHADIIGHFEQRPNDGALPGSRAWQTYDLLGSDSGFSADTFQKVWFDLFGFAVPEVAWTK